MNSRTKIDSKWLSGLAEEFPQSADQIGALAEHLLDKQDRLARLIRFCVAHPELPMMRMYAEYGAALDAVALEPPREVEPEVTDEEAAELHPRERAARTKRLRSRRKIAEAAALLARENPQVWKVEDVVPVSGVSLPTLYNHFFNRQRLTVAAYDHLVVNA